MDESDKKVSYVINVCGKLGNSAPIPTDCQGKDAVCLDGDKVQVTSRTFYYEGTSQNIGWWWGGGARSRCLRLFLSNANTRI